MKRIVLTFGIFLLAANVFAQVPAIKNPTAIVFTSPDHDNADVTGYEVDILNATTNALVQTLNVAKSATTKETNGDIRVTVNVQPINFGSYTFVVRAVAGAVKSDNSPETDIWERVPGRPSKPTSF